MSSRLTTIVQLILLFVAIALSTYVALEAFKPRRPAPVAMEPPPRFQGAGGRGQGMSMRGMETERKLVSTFDRDHDGVLNSAERLDALRSLQQQDDFARFGRGNQADRSEPGMRIAPGSVRTYPAVPLYDQRVLRTIFLTFEPQDWQRELASFYRTDVDVPATVIVDGRTYRDVGVHFRGNSSYRMVPYGLKHSLNLSFDFKNKDQEIDGYKTLNLLNSNNDPTFMRTMLYSEIARHYVPTARTSFVRVVINGESWGIYVNAEQVNKDFLQEWFKDDKGLRWKVPGSPRARGGLEYLGDDTSAYKTHYEIKSKDEPASWAALAKLCKVLNETPASQLPAALEPMLDVDGVLKFLAVDLALVNADGYWTRASDYNIYRNTSGTFHVFPHDFNEAFAPEEGGRGGFRRGGVDEGGPDLNPMIGVDDEAKPLRSRLLVVPQWRERYLGYVHDIAQRWLEWETLKPTIREWQALIEADVKSDTKKINPADAFDDGKLREFIEKRQAYLLR